MTENCPNCGTEPVAFAVPGDLREYLPGEEPAAAVCPHCLTLRPCETDPAEPPAFERFPAAFPDDPDVAVPMALLVGLLDSLALYRAEITALLERVERGGTDPLLVIDRLGTDPDVSPEPDLRGRRRQLEQLL